MFVANLLKKEFYENGFNESVKKINQKFKAVAVDENIGEEIYTDEYPWIVLLDLFFTVSK